MKKGVLFILFLVPCLLFGQDQLKNQINTVLDEWHAAAATADMEAYFDKIDEEGIYIGTDASENWTKQAFYEWSKPYFDKGKAWTFKAVERNIYFSVDHSLAWFDDKLEASYGVLRGSGVLWGITISRNRNDRAWFNGYCIGISGTDHFPLIRSGRVMYPGIAEILQIRHSFNLPGRW